MDNYLNTSGGAVCHDYISGKNLLTFKGTDSLNDWYNNIKQATDPPSPEYSAAMSIAFFLSQHWTGPSGNVFTPDNPANWLITGHSLGGGLAAAAAVVSGFHADTFNAAGVNYTTVNQFTFTYEPALTFSSWQALQDYAAAGLVTSYVVDYDILNRAQDGFIARYSGLPASIGTRITLDSHSDIGISVDLYRQYRLHSYYIQSVLLSYNLPLS